MQHAPPLRPEVMYEDIWANKLTAAVLGAVLGTNPVCNFADGNTALGDGYGGRQGVHADMAYNFPQMPCTVTANYYLEDASKANGSTELWLGSARDTTFRDHKACRELGPGDDALMPKKISLHTEDDNYAMEANFGVRNDILEVRREFAPPVQPSVKGGSVMLRDLRLWHAGIANPSQKTRIMLNFIYTPWWYKVSRLAGLSRLLHARSNNADLHSARPRSICPKMPDHSPKRGQPGKTTRFISRLDSSRQRRSVKPNSSVSTLAAGTQGTGSPWIIASWRASHLSTNSGP
jgi:hypothetical protein